MALELPDRLDISWTRMGVDEWSRWCDVDEPHIYFVAPKTTFLSDDGEPAVQKGDLIVVAGFTYEVCNIHECDPIPGDNWFLVYVHPREEVQPMTEDEWHGLYGNPELA